jgi:hypothetical protein
MAITRFEMNSKMDKNMALFIVDIVFEKYLKIAFNL